MCALARGLKPHVRLSPPPARAACTGGRQIGLQRLQRRIERAAQRADGGGGAALHLLGLLRVLEQMLERGGKLLRAGNEPEALVALQNLVGFGEIEGMRATQDAGTELDGLDRICPPCSISEPPMKDSGASL